MKTPIIAFRRIFNFGQTKKCDKCRSALGELFEFIFTDGTKKIAHSECK